MTAPYRGADRRRSHLPDWAITKSYMEWTLSGLGDRRDFSVSARAAASMTVREQFVGHAIAGLCAKWGGLTDPRNVAEVASIAVAVADAAIAKLASTPNPRTKDTIA